VTTIVDVLPVLGLVIDVHEEGRSLQLRGITDADLAALVDVVAAGVHDPVRTPFTVPWTDVEPAALPLGFAQYHWRARADWSAAAWKLNLGVWVDGRIVGVQGCDAEGYLVTRTAETGSWLGRTHQGTGTGTLMRRGICAFLFDHLGAARVTSGFFTDNPASGAVSRKLGYRPNGLERRERRPGELATLQHLVLDPDDFDRGGVRVEVSGLGPFRRSIGLDEAPR
jgi:RimJ/RimL family protein N-acetyltransferase